MDGDDIIEVDDVILPTTRPPAEPLPPIPPPPPAPRPDNDITSPIRPKTRDLLSPRTWDVFRRGSQ